MGARREWFEVGWGLRRAVARLGREEERREAGYRSRKKRRGKMMRRIKQCCTIVCVNKYQYPFFTPGNVV